MHQWYKGSFNLRWKKYSLLGVTFNTGDLNIVGRMTTLICIHRTSVFLHNASICRCLPIMCPLLSQAVIGFLCFLKGKINLFGAENFVQMEL